MNSQLEHRLSRGGITALAILAIAGLLIFLIATVDGRIAAWSQQLAQNVAEAAVLAGTRSLHEIMQSSGFVCAATPDNLIMEQMQLYADLNRASDAVDPGLSIQGYYLTSVMAEDYQFLYSSETGERWKVGTTGSVPCEAIQGLHVEVYYPQETLLTRLFGINHARVVVEAAAASPDGAPWGVTLVARERLRFAPEQAAAIIRYPNQPAGLESALGGRIGLYLNGSDIIEETLLGKQVVVSGKNAAAPAGSAAGTKVGLLKAAGRVIQSVSALSEIGM